MEKSAFDPAHQQTHTGSKIIASLERIAQAFRVLLWNESKTNTLSPIQIQILIFLLHHEKSMGKVSYLADEFNLSKPTISDAVKSLEEKQLIGRKTEDADARSQIIFLTRKGKTTATQSAMFGQQLEKPIAQLSASEKEKLLIQLLGIIRHLNKAGIITLQRMCFTCTHYEQKGDAHFCRLLNQRLSNTELRIDCPEHALSDSVY
jgi:DNA-binding MarR family transcriptional regulator